MNNFPFTYYGKEYWYSRSIVCTNYIFARVRDIWYVLAVQRGRDQTQPNKWNVPGGFLDHDETCEECAIRETHEETGMVYFDDVHLFDINSRPYQSDKQHVIMSYYTNLGKFENMYNLPTFNTNFAESGEVQQVKWIPISSIYEYRWINNQKEMILKIYNDRINPNFIKRIRNFIIDCINIKNI